MTYKKIQFSDFIENYKNSGRLMEFALFKPIEIKKWAKLGFLSFLNQIPLFIFLFFFNFLIIPARFLEWNKIFPVLPHIIITFPFLLAVFLIFLCVFIYISGYSNYFYLEFLISKKVDINKIEDYHKKLAKNYFILAFLIFLFLALFFSLGLFLIFLFRDILTKVFLFLFLFFFVFFFIFIQIILKDFYIPSSYINKKDILENISYCINIILSNPLKFLAFLILKSILILILSSGVLFMGILSFGLLFILFIIPILSQTILQPLIYFLNIFGLIFFQESAKLKRPLIKDIKFSNEM